MSFIWKDYGENSALFIDGMERNVAILRYKDFRLHDNATGMNKIIRVDNLDDAKKEAEIFLIGYWEKVRNDLNNNLRRYNTAY